MGVSNASQKRSHAARLSAVGAIVWALVLSSACQQSDDGSGSGGFPQGSAATATGTTSSPASADPAAQDSATGAGSDTTAGAASDGVDSTSDATGTDATADTSGAMGEDGDPAADDGSAAQADDEMSGAAGASGGEEMPATPEEPMDLGVGDGSDVVTIGDSWMSYALSRGGIEGALERAGKDYRNYAVAGTTLGGSIPGQFDRAKDDDPNISTVIMTGGGNDIMFSGACNTSAGCEEAIAMLVENLDALWTTMADDGVRDIIYIAYAEDAGTTPQSTRPEGEAPVPSICLTGRIRCHSLETTDLVMGSLVDGIHPTSTANDRIAEALLQLMEDEGIRR